MIHCPNGSPTALFNEVVAPKFRSNEACTATQKVIATATERIVPAILQTPFTKPRLTPSSIPKIMIAKKRMSKTHPPFAKSAFIFPPKADFYYNISRRICQRLYKTK